MKKSPFKNSSLNKILNILKQEKTPVKVVIIAFMLGSGVGVAWEEIVGIGTWHSYHPPLDKFNICFTPPSGCASLIANEIVKAKSSIYLQAYGLTSKPIIRQLVKAQDRGVRVNILLDGSNLSHNNKVALELKKAGIKVGIDKISSGIAHNKVIIIDNYKVVTGSFNFTTAADTKNAENVLLIEDKNIAQIYLSNWRIRKKLSIPY
ncbi:phospholipase D family nuclease [Candidatus Midichloria mitochondrii]|uniref:Phospholipase D n=1 Tax=Midichloria mitochondrii (strain IricVA) TaxID=696127 RepID=F7XW49_MIDMI|nr:phospholipase D family protein [Candidatus Midichloria mitochondrii]AEI88898.1 cardiolipin synthase [Candidatus Midichloria mitochondrii IricVA]